MSLPATRRRLSEAFALAMQQFARNSTLNGVKYLARRRLTLLERCLWYVVEICAAYVVVYLVLHSWRSFVETPTTTSLDNPNLPISMVEFPGISVCGINKISKAKADQFARKLSLRMNKSEEAIKKNLKLIGHLYSFQYFAERHNDYVEFQAILDDYYNLTSRETVPSYVAMQLIKNCTELLSDCEWKGVKRECDDLFVFQTTMEGYCCIFNYLPWTARRVSPILYERIRVLSHSNASNYKFPSFRCCRCEKEREQLPSVNRRRVRLRRRSHGDDRSERQRLHVLADPLRGRERARFLLERLPGHDVRRPRRANRLDRHGDVRPLGGDQFRDDRDRGHVSNREEEMPIQRRGEDDVRPLQLQRLRFGV